MAQRRRRKKLGLGMSEGTTQLIGIIGAVAGGLIATTVIAVYAKKQAAQVP